MMLRGTAQSDCARLRFLCQILELRLKRLTDRLTLRIQSCTIHILGQSMQYCISVFGENC